MKDKKVNSSLKILCTSDLHMDEKVADEIIKIIKDEKIDVFIGAGDFHTKEFTDKFLSRVKIRGFVVSGNWDHVTFKNEHISSLDFGIEEYRGYYFFCVGNCIYFNFNQIANAITKNIDPEKLVFVTHYPPYHVLDKIWSGRHVGYPEFRDFIEERKPILHVFGHIHEDSGHMLVGNTLAVNCSLPDSKKLYIVELPSKKVTPIDLKKRETKKKKTTRKKKAKK